MAAEAKLLTISIITRWIKIRDIDSRGQDKPRTRLAYCHGKEHQGKFDLVSGSWHRVAVATHAR